MVRMHQLLLRYPTGGTALAGVSLHVPAGGFYYLIGESGAGKSSLLKLIYGALRPTAGHLSVQGLDLRQAKEKDIRQLRRRIGVIFQDYKLLWRRTVFENVALSLRVQGWRYERLLPRVRKVLGFVGLEDRMWAYPEALSGGEQQRVAIARAICANPPLILADEPTGNLDLETARRIMDYIVTLHRKGVTVIMATHDLQLLESHPAGVIRLHQGRLCGVMEAS